MAQSVPSTLALAQALELVSQLRKEYETKAINDPQKVSELINDVLTQFNIHALGTLIEFEPIMKSEPPHALKMNKYWEALEVDLNILQFQLDLLKSSTISLHNSTKTDILRNQDINQSIQNKIKTLSLYSETADNSVIKFADGFLNDELIDWSSTIVSERANLIAPGFVGLATTNKHSDFIKTAKVTVLSTSNGVLGNNQEVSTDTANVITNPSTNEIMFSFVGDQNNYSNLKSLIDSNPTSWIEYERYKVSDQDRATAENLGFTYKKTDTGYFDWAAGPDSDTLHLDIEIDLQKSYLVDTISLTPFGLTDNQNNPIKITKIIYSDNGTDWETVNPQNVWVATSVNKNITLSNEKISINQATWVIDHKSVRFMRFFLEQSRPINVPIGHLYYLKGAVDPFARTGLETGPRRSIQFFPESDPLVYSRVEGPIPNINTPTEFNKTIPSLNASDILQKREILQGQRWAIGIRDIQLDTNTYKQQGVFVTKKFVISGIIDRVALEAEIEIPNGLASPAFIKFFVSPNDGTDWYQISRIQDDYMDIPEIIAFNNPIPLELRESGVKYYDLANVVVNSIRLKVEFDNGDVNSGVTPILKSYTLKVKQR